MSNKESLRYHLAEQVMEWEKKPCEHDMDYWWWMPNEGVYYTERFEPDKNDGQAMMCLRRFDYDGWEIFVEGDVIKVVIFNADDELEAEVYAREEAEGELTLAICLACAKATGWKE